MSHGKTPNKTKVAQAKGRKKKPAAPGGISKRSTGAVTKQEAVLDLLRQARGSTIPAIMKATGWQQHSVRGFFAGVVRKKLGLTLKSEKPNDGDRIYRIVANTSGRSKSKVDPDRQGT
jgi:Protein of unknown function (DUF3489)